MSGYLPLKIKTLEVVGIEHSLRVLMLTGC